MVTRKSTELTLHDKLSRLTLQDATALLGEKAKGLLSRGSQFDIDLQEHTQLTSNRYTVRFDHPDQAIASIGLSDDRKNRLICHCSQCMTSCEHIGAALSFVLEEKTALGLAKAPQEADESIDIVVDDETLVENEINARRERADKEKMRVKSVDPTRPWVDYTVASKLSGKTYRVALRGMQPGESYCSCADFRKNTLGTCKHILNVQNKIKKKFNARQLGRAYKLRSVIVYIEYGVELSLRVGIPKKIEPQIQRLLKPYQDKSVADVAALVRVLGKLERHGISPIVYPDAEEYIQQHLMATRLRKEIEKIQTQGAKHPLRKKLLKVELLPYQFEGILFATNAGRCILADDMGLGKTIQGIGTAELMAKLASINKVLIICPASLKAQWRSEILRFSDRSCQLVVGAKDTRASQYNNAAFFTICNYEQVLRDFLHIEQVNWDLIILDEGHRIKNWEAKTSRIVKSLKSKFALVLTGTPMENRIDELYSVAEFIDERRLGPGFRFLHRHRITDEKGKVIGYRNLAELRENLKPILLRRTRASVLSELPPRTTEIIRITPTDEQLQMHIGHMQIVLSIVNKPYLSEMDLLRLQKALLMCRMTANSTELVDKQSPGYSSKLELTDTLLPELAIEEDRKIVLFSEWTTMLSLIEAQLNQHGIGFVRLDGSVPQQKRAALVSQFREDKSCRFFLSTNAGATGLNLQFANTLVNIDLPWTPAILEQRIGRIHRMGQKQAVQVYVLVTENTLEENLLATLAAKHELALAALDSNSDIDEVDLVSGMEALKRKLEVLLGAKPEAPQDQSQQQQVIQEANVVAQRERMALAGGQLMNAAFDFMGTLVPAAQEQTAESQRIAAELKTRLEQCTTSDEQGRVQLTVTLPDETALNNLADTIAALMAETKVAE